MWKMCKFQSEFMKFNKSFSIVWVCMANLYGMLLSKDSEVSITPKTRDTCLD